MFNLISEYLFRFCSSQVKSAGMTSSYRPVLFEENLPGSMIKTLTTLIKVQHHKFTTLALDKRQLLCVKSEILTAINPQLPTLQIPVDNEKIEEMVSEYYDHIVTTLVDPFLIHYETESSTKEDFEKAKSSYIKSLGDVKLLGEDHCKKLITEWIKIADLSITPKTQGTKFGM